MDDFILSSVKAENLKLTFSENFT